MERREKNHKEKTASGRAVESIATHPGSSNARHRNMIIKEVLIYFLFLRIDLIRYFSMVFSSFFLVCFNNHFINDKTILLMLIEEITVY